MRRAALLFMTVTIQATFLMAACGESEAPGPTATPTTPTPTATSTPTLTPTVAPTSAPTAAPADGDPVAGQQVFIDKGCGACHVVDGVAGAVGTIGPNQNDVATRAEARVPGLTAEEYIRESIEDPQAFVVDGYQPVMPVLRGTMTDEEFDDLVAFLLTLR